MEQTQPNFVLKWLPIILASISSIVSLTNFLKIGTNVDTKAVKNYIILSLVLNLLLVSLIIASKFIKNVYLINVIITVGAFLSLILLITIIVKISKTTNTTVYRLSIFNILLAFGILFSNGFIIYNDYKLTNTPNNSSLQQIKLKTIETEPILVPPY